jgi:crossover junction endodeoxyribonuclease RuvC
MRFKYFVGIDPGKSGGLVRINKDGAIVDKLVMPLVAGKEVDFGLVYKFLSAISPPCGDEMVLLEKVGAMPKQGVVSMFNFGQTLGGLKAVLQVKAEQIQMPWALVTPLTWQKSLHEGVDKTMEPKKRSLMAFQRLYPGVDLRKSERARIPHDGLVDALLIAEYGRRKYGV